MVGLARKDSIELTRIRVVVDGTTLVDDVSARSASGAASVGVTARATTTPTTALGVTRLGRTGRASRVSIKYQLLTDLDYERGRLTGIVVV